MALKVVIGLGNPEPKYERTRHNVGFRLIESLAIKYGAQLQRKSDLQCELGKVSIFGVELLLIRPLTYMNLSGRAASAIARWHKVDLKDMLVIHDDVSLPLGMLRFQRAGGAGGQHGIESIIECFGGKKDFDRLKVGVGPDPGGERRADYVLSIFPEKEENLLVTTILPEAANGIEAWLKEGILAAMNKFNGRNLHPDAAIPELIGRQITGEIEQTNRDKKKPLNET